MPLVKPYKNVLPKIAPNAYIADDAVVIGDVEIGAESSVWFGCVIRGDVNFIRIGDRTNIQDRTVIHVSSDTFATTLEDEVTIGHSATLHGCHIEKGCLIGMGAILLDGVHVGQNSLIAAGSLLTPGTIIPPGSMVMGSPAKVKRPLTAEEIEGLPQFWKNYVSILSEYR